MPQLTLERAGPDTAPRLGALLDRDPVRNVFLRSELRLHGTNAAWLVLSERNELRAAVLAGSLAAPCIPRQEDAPSLVSGLLGAGLPHLVLGPREDTLALVEALRPVHPPAEVRDPQPIMAVDAAHLARLPGATLQRPTRQHVDMLASAAAAMHREEQRSPGPMPAPSAWRPRTAQLVERGWSWVWLENGRLIFKAELSAWTPEAVQVQGVYTSPEHRRRGVATAGMAALCTLLLAEVPLVTLYVNEWNEAAMRLYRRLGFRQQGAFATVMY